jgi:hypothetical protein
VIKTVYKKEFEKEKKKMSISPSSKKSSQSPSNKQVLKRTPSPALGNTFPHSSSLFETRVCQSPSSSVGSLDSTYSPKTHIPPLPPSASQSKNIHSMSSFRTTPPSHGASVSSPSPKDKNCFNSIGFVEIQVFDIINHTDLFSGDLPPFLESLTRQTLLGDWTNCPSFLLSKYALETTTRRLSTATMCSDTYIGLIEILFILFFFLLL